MKRFFSWMAIALMSVAMLAGENDLLWDYTDAAPSKNPDNGLTYGSKINDANLKGIKMNSSGFAYFTKAAVAGKLKLTYGPRNGGSVTLKVSTWTGDTPSAQTLIQETKTLSELGYDVIELSETQNNIYISRTSSGNEGVLQKIQFREGFDDAPEPCIITYKDQTGKVIGTVDAHEGDTLKKIPYGIEDLTPYSKSHVFRGWFYTNNIKVQIGDIISGNTTIQAHVTRYEHAREGSVWVYDFTDPTFYVEDHDLITRKGNEITLTLGGEALKAIVIVKDNGTTTTKKYDGDAAVTLTVTDKLQKITVYIVRDFLEQDPTTGYYIIPAGDVASFLYALELANTTGNAKIFLPNGTYDMGEIVLTTISKDNIALIGESMDQTIIKNAPDAAKESIDQTATIKINKNVSGTYLQDLTLQNALDYYKNDNGRAVALWDQGTQTVCKNVKLLSYQDTYYSNLQGAVKYFEDCEIHGTVDFICGDGSVYFKNNLLYCEKRKAAGGGSDALTASNADGVKDRGYVFEGCAIQSECPVVSFGRAWNNTPQVVFINTLVDYSAGNFSFSNSEIQRWTKKLMNANAWPKFYEYNTHLGDGTVLTPGSNIVTFLDEKSGNATQNLETVLSAQGAATYTMAYTLGSWATTAEADAKQAECEKTADEFEPDGIYLVEGDGEFAGIILGSEFMNKFALYNGVKYTVRKANARGGFGAPTGEGETGIERVAPLTVCNHKVIRDGLLYIMRDNKTYNAIGQRML